MIAKAARSVLASVVMLVACAPTTPPAPTQTQVQDFLQDYVAAFNAGDDSKLMGLINRDSAVSSIASGRLYRGWDAIRVSSSENLAAVADVRVAIGAVEVTAIGADTALAVAPMVVTAERFPLQGGGKLTSEDLPGALTMIVKRTPEGLRLIHEHHSVRVR